EDHLQVRVATGVLDLDDLVEDRRVVAGQERAAVDDHVDLVRARGHRRLDLGDLDVAEGLAGREAGRDAGDLDARPAEGVLRVLDQGRVDADGRDGWDGRVARLRVDGLGAHRPDLAGCVLALEGRQIHHPDRQVEGPQLGGLLDRAALQALDAELDAHLVDRRLAAEDAAEGARTAARPGPDELAGALAG